MKFSRLLFAVAITAISLNAAAQKLADPILLWPAGAPGATGSSDEDKPAVIPFIPEAAKRNGAAVLVVPGGGFTIRAVDHEGVLIAQWLKEHGITAFLLRYRLRPIYTRNEWVLDGQRGMQYIRAHADDYKISPDRVGAIGFSAGATLIADMALNPIKINAPDMLSTMPSKPNFLILGYGSTRITDNTDQAALAAMPPTFMYGTVEDRGSQTGMLDMYTRLYRANVPVEAHFFRNGIHGTGFALGDPVLGQWTTLLHNWMTGGGYLSVKPQISLAGVVKLDGSPLLDGMVIFTPVDNKDAPPAIVFIRNTGTGELGRFLVPKNQGPAEGRYKVEVRQDATRWTSNSREPFMISMMDKQSRNTLTDDDKKAWADYIRKRDLSPSIYKQRVFSHKRPGDKGDYIVDIKSGKEVLIEVFSK
ncbi:alpha/beta hydrolase [Mucilaginibacter calamicampi]|uniref:Alpha/beta hydrolase n=1 Tax=Mucilaginibacter calamicampi TaxID=1302352 RepID=A0ABW2Z3H6_9SPHI